MDLEHTVLQSNPASETYPDSNRVVIDDGIILKLILDKPSGVKIGQHYLSLFTKTIYLFVTHHSHPNGFNWGHHT